jgi:hypothetical protein
MVGCHGAKEFVTNRRTAVAELNSGLIQGSTEAGDVRWFPGGCRRSEISLPPQQRGTLRDLEPWIAALVDKNQHGRPIWPATLAHAAIAWKSSRG